MNKLVYVILVVFLNFTLNLSHNEIIELSHKIQFEGFTPYQTMAVDSKFDQIIESSAEYVTIDVKSEASFNYNLGNYYDIKPEEVNAIKSKRIAAGAKYFSAINKNTYSKLPYYDYKNIYLSKYFPIVSFEIESKKLTTSNYEVLNKIAEISNVEKIIVKSNKSGDLEEYCYNAQEDMNVRDEVVSGNLTGAGVKIGILDAGIIDEDNENFVNSNLTIRNHFLYIETVDDHATAMATLAAGTCGVAKNASIYSVEAFNSLSGELDWLVDKEVDVVNISIGTESTGVYDELSALVDEMIWNYGITVCVASGNSVTDESNLVCNPAIAFNAITVGAAAETSYLRRDSCYNTITEVDKPTLIAPGSGVCIPNVYYGGQSGTSISSALTTGVVALLMELDPTLKLYPQKVAALLTANTNYLINTFLYQEASGLDEHVGAGLINFSKAKENINNCTYFQFNGTAEDSDILYSTQAFYLNSNNFVRVSMAWLAKTTGNVNSFRVNDFELALLGPRGGQVESTWSTYNNIDMLAYTASDVGNYRFMVIIYDTIYNLGNQDVFICWNITT